MLPRELWLEAVRWSHDAVGFNNAPPPPSSDPWQIVSLDLGGAWAASSFAIFYSDLPESSHLLGWLRCEPQREEGQAQIKPNSSLKSFPLTVFSFSPMFSSHLLSEVGSALCLLSTLPHGVFLL